MQTQLHINQAVIPNTGRFAGKECTIKAIDLETREARIQNNILGPAIAPLESLIPHRETNLLKKYRVREQKVRDGDGFFRFDVFGTPRNGTEEIISSQALEDDTFREINAWIEAQEDAEFAIYK